MRESTGVEKGTRSGPAELRHSMWGAVVETGDVGWGEPGRGS